MANSTNILADATTLHGMTPNSASEAKMQFLGSIAFTTASGEVTSSAQDLIRSLMLLASSLDSTDAALTLINNILGTLGYSG